MKFDSPAVHDATRTAALVVDRLKTRETDRVVFAESCTAGMVAGLLGQFPGISNWLCGSAVTYRESVKQKWLGVSPETLEKHTAESLQTTQEMAVGVLQSIVEATHSTAVTGHLGPQAPSEIDGLIFICVARRSTNTGEIEVIANKRFQLQTETRIDRQFESAFRVFETLHANL
ncbi:MAG: CinA family protein [Mariniblastus sp.]